ncbi:MAG: hypothetical protein ACRBG0_06235 [Lewinella sp.]|jgi:hypothetical protein|uniref:hypothetical protein n=1 Tax=Lewinella sp. TaxID=2004506 RepID=UPI003D6B12BB
MNETKIFGNPIPLYLLAIAFGLWVSAEVVSSKLMVVLFGIYCLGQVVTMQIVRLTSTSMSFRDNLLKTKVEIDFEKTLVDKYSLELLDENNQKTYELSIEFGFEADDLFVKNNQGEIIFTTDLNSFRIFKFIQSHYINASPQSHQ